jgi:uncharacterized membrane protein YciS (DUF1049 family)
MSKHTTGWRGLYGGVMKVWGIGYGAILGRAQGIINISLIGSTYLLAKGFELSFFETIGFGIVVIIFVFASGLIYIKLDLQKAEYSSNIKEQPELKEMYDKINEIYDKMGLNKKNEP